MEELYSSIKAQNTLQTVENASLKLVGVLAKFLEPPTLNKKDHTEMGWFTGNQIKEMKLLELDVLLIHQLNKQRLI